MPGPLSLTERYCPPALVQPTLIVIEPPRGVNLIALVRRLSTIWRMARSSAQMRGRFGLDELLDLELALLRADREQMAAILRDGAERDGSPP